MISRVTNQTLMRSAQRNLQDSMTLMAAAQNKATNLTKISKPSDDPIGTGDSMRIRAEQRATAQHQRNISDGAGWLTTIDTALSTTTRLLGKVRDLTVQGANDGTMSATAREAIAVELENLRDELLNQANTTYLGRSVFAGTSDAGHAFAADFSFTGGTGTVERRIAPDTTVRVDAGGADVFGQDDTSVFALINTIAADLRAGTPINVHLTALDERITTVIGQHGAVGARHAQLLRAEEENMEKAGALEAQRSEVEDVDIARALLDLKLQEVTYQSALAVTARVLQPTLMDFLR